MLSSWGKGIICKILFGFIFNLLIVSTVWAQELVKDRQVIFIICDQLEFGDLNSSELPHLHNFFKNGAVALLNTNTAGSRNRPNAAATVSAGSVTLGTPKESLAFNASETYQGQNAQILFQARTGVVPRQGNIVVIDYPLICSINETAQTGTNVGVLGETIRRWGLRTAVLGNADLPGVPQRTMAVIAMDQQGIVDGGNVSSDVLTIEKDGFMGVRTNYNALKSNFLSLKNEANFIVIDLGDLVRLEQNKQFITDKIYSREKNTILHEVDHFLGWILTNIDPRRCWIIFSSLSPTVMALNQKRLFTFIGVQGEYIKSGLLVSPTTRRPGIVTLYDIAPSIISYLGAPVPNTMGGRPWYVEPANKNLEIIQNIEASTAFNSTIRLPVLRGFIIFYLFVLACVLWLSWFDPRKSKYLQSSLLSLVAIPLVFLIIPLFSPHDLGIYLLIIFGTTIVLVLISILLARNPNLDSFLFLCLATVITLVLDTLTGGNLQGNSVLSYDTMAGARFYGIGNEYMGVLLGATLMGSSLLVQRLTKFPQVPRICAGILFLLVAGILGSPKWGSNFGGVIAALIAFTYTFFRFTGVRLHGRKIFLGGLIIFIVCLGLLLLDYTRPPELRSHFGQLVATAQSEGLRVVKEIVARKLIMNYRLIKYTIWTKVLLGTLLALGLLFWRPVAIFRRVLTKNPAITGGLEGSLLGAFAALVFNDSGVVAAATAIIFPAVLLFFLVLKELEASL